MSRTINNEKLILSEAKMAPEILRDLKNWLQLFKMAPDNASESNAEIHTCPIVSRLEFCRLHSAGSDRYCLSSWLHKT